MSLIKNLNPLTGLKKDIEEAKEELAEIEFVGTSKNNHVIAYVTGNFKVKKFVVSFNSDQVVDFDEFTEAVNDALDKAKQEINERISREVGGIIPPLF